MRNTVLISFLILSFNIFAMSDSENLQNALDEANNYLNYHQQSIIGSCPGVSLVKTCGNKICEAFNNESIENCPSDCKENITVRSYNNITLCDEYIQTQIPHNAKEVQDIIRLANFRGVNVKAIGASHSATDIMCSNGILIPTMQMNNVLGIKKVNENLVVETEPGITVFELSKWLDKKGYALHGLPHMGFRDVTIGGSMATSSHGSTPTHTGVISSIIEGVEFVDGLGEIRNLTRDDSDEFKALSANLGLLGIVTKVQLKIQKSFNLAVRVTHHHESEILNNENGILEIVKDCDYGQLNWFPGVRKFARTCGKKTTNTPHAWADNILLKPKTPNFIVSPFKQVLQLGTCNNRLMGLVERVRYWMFKLNPPFVRKKRFRRSPKNSSFVIGKSYRMVSSHLTKAQDGLFQMDWELAVPASKAQAALKAIREHMNKNNTKLPLVGVFVRYAPSEDKTLMAYTVSDGDAWKNGETAVFFEMPVFIPVGFSDKKFEEYERQFSEFARMLIDKFSARPHWGKNRDWVFKYAKDAGAYPYISRFRKVRMKFDPNNIFANDYGRVLGINN